MTRYRAEIYDNSFNFISFGAVSDKNLKADYLAEETSTVTIPQLITASIDNYVAVRTDGIISNYGVITNVSYDDNKTTISFTDFMNKLNVDVMEDVSVFESTAVETWLVDKLTELYQGDDEYQNIYGFSASADTSTIITYEAASTDTTFESINIYNFVQELLQKYNILLKWVVDFYNKTVTCTIGTIDTTDVWNLKLGLADTPEFNIDIHTIEGNYNKIKYYNSDDTTDTVTYYLHSDGTIDEDYSTDRLTPVNYTEKTAAADTTEGAEQTFAEVALTDAENSMINSDYNHEITLTFNATSLLMSVGEIGQVYNLIIPSGVTYNSVLTGFEDVNAKYVKMIFGYIRTNLTTILKMQKRRKT